MAETTERVRGAWRALLAAIGFALLWSESLLVVAGVLAVTIATLLYVDEQTDRGHERAIGEEQGP